MTATLELDATSIKPDALSRETLVRELNLQKRPSWILSKCMNALESKRAKKGLGWSRPWNKYGLTVFRTHTHDLEKDSAYLQSIKEAMAPLIASLPTEYVYFANKLWNDENKRAFTFYHNNSDESGEFEGLTFSIGCKDLNDRTKRDRLDIILEDRRSNGKVDGQLDRVRIYVNPWSQYQNKNYELVELQTPNAKIPQQLQELYNASKDLYDLWKKDEARQWSHWSVKYIDYFGARSFIPKGSSFL